MNRLIALRDTVNCRGILVILGWLAVLYWAVFWLQNIKQHKFQTDRMWVPAYSSLGIDFESNYYSVRHWLAGGNPYVEPFEDPLDRPLIYPPTTLYIFSWTGAFSARTAMRIWFVIQCLLALLCSHWAYRSRERIGASRVPFPVILAGFLWSFPLLFALERGNWDLAIAPLCFLYARCLAKGNCKSQWGAAACLVALCCLKYYAPILAGVALFRRRYLCLGITAVAIGCLFGLFHTLIAPIRENLAATTEFNRPKIFYPSVHSMTGYWLLIQKLPSLAFAQGISPKAAGFAVIGLPSLALFFAWLRSPNADDLTAPVLLWLTAGLTFLPVVANDYNLLFLPLAALCVWDRRDGATIHIAMGYFLLIWQPFMLPIGPKLLFLFKVLGYYAVGGSILAKLRCSNPTLAANESRRRSITVIQKGF